MQEMNRIYNRLGKFFFILASLIGIGVLFSQVIAIKSGTQRGQPSKAASPASSLLPTSASTGG